MASVAASDYIQVNPLGSIFPSLWSHHPPHSTSGVCLVPWHYAGRLSQQKAFILFPDKLLAGLIPDSFWGHANAKFGIGEE